MNNLSWMIYLANTVGNVSNIAAFITIVSLIGAVAWGAVGGAILISSGKEDEVRDWKLVGKFVIPTLVISALIMAIIPDKGTMYAIIASESGEQLLNSETGSKAQKALNAWLDAQINQVVGEDND